MLRRPPKSDATSNNFFGLFERHVSGVESLFTEAPCAIEFDVFKWVVSERSFDALINCVADDHLPSLTARSKVIFLLVSLAAVLNRSRADAALNRDSTGEEQLSRPIVIPLPRQFRQRRPVGYFLRQNYRRVLSTHHFETSL